MSELDPDLLPPVVETLPYLPAYRGQSYSQVSDFVKKLDRERPVKTSEVAAYLGVTPRTVANWRKTGRIPYFSINSRNVRYFLSDVEKALSKPAMS